jgi:hypothetical protein
VPKLVGGGARTNYSGFGSLLTQSYPSSLTAWTTVAKDHLSADPATVTSYAIGINDPTGDWQVGIFPSQPSSVSSHPSASASLPAGYVLTGGGCVDNWAPTGAAGNLLTASYPTLPPGGQATWECRGKDHSVASPAAITAFVVGIRPTRPGIPLPIVQITTATSAVAELPEVVAPVVPGATVTGGGAAAAPVDPNGWGQLLTGTYPEIDASGTVTGWHAKSKDHMVASQGTVTAFAINVIFQAPTSSSGATAASAPPTITSLSRPNGQPSDPITIFGSGFGEAGGFVHFVVGPGIDIAATTIAAWHDTRIDLNVPARDGIATPYPGIVYVTRTGSRAQSLPASFEFDPAYDLVELPMPPPPNAIGGPDSTYFDRGGTTYGWRWDNTVGWIASPGASQFNITFFGYAGFDEFFVTKRLINGWTVADAQVIVNPPTNTYGNAPGTAGAYIAVSMIGTNSPYLKVRYWQQASCMTFYRPRIWVRGPKGVPYW